MIKIITVFFALLLLGCTNEPPTLFELQTDTTFTIPAGLDNFRTHIFQIKNIPTRINAVFNPSNEDLLSGIFPNRAVITTPFVNFDLRLINTAVINIWNPQFPEDKKEVFFIDFMNNRNQNELQLFSSLSEVKDILLNNTFDAEVRIVFRVFTPTEIDARLNMNFVAHGKQ